MELVLRLLIVLGTVIISPQVVAGLNLANFDLILLSHQTKETLNQSVVFVSEGDHDSDAVELPFRNNSRYEVVTLDEMGENIYWTAWNGTFGVVGVYSIGELESTVIYTAGKNRTVSELNYSNGTVYWVENTNEIRSLSVITNETADVIVRAGPNEKIRGLTMDKARGTLYYAIWPNSDHRNSSIWSKNLKDSSTPLLLASNLLMPISMTFSPPETLHWAVKPSGIFFNIERLNLSNHVERTVVASQSHTYANSIAVTCKNVYWTDRTDRRVMRADYQVTSKTPVNVPIMNMNFRQVAAIRPCANVQTAMSRVITTTTTESSSTTTEEVSSTSAAQQASIKLCSSMDANQCPSHSLCVVIEHTPMCLYTSAPTTSPPLRLLKDESKAEALVAPVFSKPSLAVISVLASMCTLFFIVCLLLLIQNRRLNKKPIIRRRVVVSTRTSESGSTSPASVCEMIDIENCCNMNVCETPCYERTLLNPASASSNNIVTINSTNERWCGSGSSCSGKTDKTCLLK